MASGTFYHFSITGQVPDFNMALGDSIFIDMSKYWKGDIGCNKRKYIPDVLKAKSSSDLFELRTANKYLIVKAKKTGSSEIAAYAEELYDTDSCVKSSESKPIRFRVTVGSGSGAPFQHSIKDTIGNWLLRVEINPKKFNYGDTVAVRAIALDTAVVTNQGFWKYDFTWLVDGNNQIISTLGDDDYCYAGFQESTSNSIQLIVMDSTKVIRGFVHIKNGDGTELENGLGFVIKSE